MQENISVLIACSETLSRIALVDLLRQEEDFTILKETHSLEDTISFLDSSTPGITLICSHLFIENFRRALKVISSNKRKTKFVVFNFNLSNDIEHILLKRGAVGILDIDIAPSKLLKALRKIHAGELWVRRAVLYDLFGKRGSYSLSGTVLHAPHLHLTRREYDVLALMVSGHRNAEIARRLFISESTVKTHINHIYRKFGVNKRSHAILYALKHHIISH